MMTARIDSVALFRYRKRLYVDPVSYGQGTDKRSTTRQYRSGLLIRVESSDIHAWGEVAPLPGYSSESISETGTALRKLLLLEKLPTLADDLEQLHVRSADWNAFPHAARFGVEQAYATLSARLSAQPLAKWLSPRSTDQIEVNTLVTGTGEELLRQVAARQREGFSVFKIKVGRLGLEMDVARVREVRRLTGPGAKLRLDANRSWTFDEASRFLQSISSLKIDYVEEPLTNSERLPELYDRTGVGMAIDETFRAWTQEGVDISEKLQNWSFLKAVVLRPMLFGAFTGTLRLARCAVDSGVSPVVSSAYETPVGHAGVCAIAATPACSGSAAGLDTLRYFLPSTDRTGREETNQSVPNAMSNYMGTHALISDSDVFDSPFFTNAELGRVG